jgi:hypothetical protein
MGQLVVQVCGGASAGGLTDIFIADGGLVKAGLICLLSETSQPGLAEERMLSNI